ncbi:uncharacterized protein C8Q71DRAFT_729193 [Rhodofomes roseus]|uniref:Uncharacterized protein n=1 Tax=Rhodofomes roseus TaxID=34475 RepID=A0ABQ8KWL4_9APHY|nr:uncharacterized protein C8Q71DRAFT_729193 [Rhodofomes roseus]KAH9843601.1 hypothetical protein C8Q71DRAFT_729193 [Rhodofomes roseus]
MSFDAMQAPQQPLFPSRPLSRLNTTVVGSPQATLPTPDSAGSPHRPQAATLPQYAPLSPVAGPSTQSTHFSVSNHSHVRSPISSNFPQSRASASHYPPGPSAPVYQQQGSPSLANQPHHSPHLPSHVRSQTLPAGHPPAVVAQRPSTYAPYQQNLPGTSQATSYFPSIPPELLRRHSHNLAPQRPPSSSAREHLERRDSAHIQAPAASASLHGGNVDAAASQVRPVFSPQVPHGSEHSRQSTTSTPRPAAGPASPFIPQPNTPASAGSPPAEQQSPSQNQEIRSPFSVTQWDPQKHARLVFTSFGGRLAETIRYMEAQLSRELVSVKTHVLGLEKELAAANAEGDRLRNEKDIALRGAQAERQAAEEARATILKERGALTATFKAAQDLGNACTALRNQLGATQTELEQVKAERENLRKENWQLKEVVAKLSCDMHLSGRERREGSVAAAGDDVLSKAIAQTKDERDRRTEVERELTELKAQVSKQALLQQNCSTNVGWAEIGATWKLTGLPNPFPDSQLENQRLQDNSPGDRQTPLPSANETFTGLATPQSQAGTVDIEPASMDRAVSEVIDLTMSDSELTPSASRDRKRFASPSILDEGSVLKRRRTEEFIADGQDPQPREPSPAELERPGSSSTSIHEFGTAPLLMGLSPTTHEEFMEQDADPDQTLVDGGHSAATDSDVVLPDAKMESNEEQVMSEVETKPDVFGGRGAEPQEQHPQDSVAKQEDEDGEVKEEDWPSPQLAPAPQPEPPTQTPHLPMPKEETPPRPAPPLQRHDLSRRSTSSTSYSPAVTLHSLPPKPLFVAKPSTSLRSKSSVGLPPRPDLPATTDSPASEQRPPLRRALTISHIHLAYDEVGSRYTCVMCKRRHDKDPTLRVAWFPTNSDWPTLVGHVEREHPRGFERLVNMNPQEVAEANSRKK